MRLDPDIEMRHLCGRQWQRLLALFRPMPLRSGERGRRPLLLRVVAEGRLLKLWHSERGRLPRDDSLPWRDPAKLSAACEEARVVSLTPDALARFAARWQGALRPEMDYLEQLLVFSESFGATAEIEVYPSKRRRLPQFLGSSLLGLLLPRGRCVVLLVCHAGAVFTTLIVRHGMNGLDLVTTHEGLPELAVPDELRPDWISALAAAVATRFGPVHVGLGVEWRGLMEFRRRPGVATLGWLEQQSQLVIAKLPVALRILIWGFEHKHRRRLRRLSRARAAALSAPLSEAELNALRV